MKHILKTKEDLIPLIPEVDLWMINDYKEYMKGYPLRDTFPLTELVRKVINFDSYYRYSDSMSVYNAGCANEETIRKEIDISPLAPEHAKLLHEGLCNPRVLRPYYPTMFHRVDENNNIIFNSVSGNCSETNFYMSKLTIEELEHCSYTMTYLVELAGEITLPSYDSFFVATRATNKRSLRGSEEYKRLNIGQKLTPVVRKIEDILLNLGDNFDTFAEYRRCLIYKYSSAVRYIEASSQFNPVKRNYWELETKNGSINLIV